MNLKRREESKKRKKNMESGKKRLGASFPQLTIASLDICGFFFREPPDYTPPPALASFLAKGSTPVYIGFGSIVIDDPEQLNAVLVEAVRSVGVRAVISKGWSKLGGAVAGTTAEGDVFYLGDCPHEWLFKHVSAVVHHGGAGTTACGLLNGRPTTIVPFFGEYVSLTYSFSLSIYYCFSSSPSDSCLLLSL